MFSLINASLCRVIVLDNGRIAEFDSPKQLLSNPDGLFYSMVAETGPANMALLISQANAKQS
jgi:ABC-type multidrug transport system fused ATPase/permease subunit